MVLLLDLPMLLRKIKVQLQHNPKRVKRRLKFKFKMNCVIVLIPSLKDYLTLTRFSQKQKRKRDMPPLDDDIEDNYVGIEEEFDD